MGRKATDDPKKPIGLSLRTSTVEFWEGRRAGKSAALALADAIEKTTDQLRAKEGPPLPASSPPSEARASSGGEEVETFFKPKGR